MQSWYSNDDRGNFINVLSSHDTQPDGDTCLVQAPNFLQPHMRAEIRPLMLSPVNAVLLPKLGVPPEHTRHHCELQSTRAVVIQSVSKGRNHECHGMMVSYLLALFPSNKPGG